MMLHSLTSLRFIAAFIVVVHHYVWFDGKWPIFTHGDIGVSFFYVLSGFVLAYAYHSRLSTGAVSIRTFYAARIARIYPLHLLTLFLAIPLMATSTWQGNLHTALPFNLTLTQSFVPFRDFYLSFNSPSWSISNEAFFYALFPFLIGLRLRTLLLVAMGIAILICLAWAATRMSLHVLDYWIWIFKINPCFRLFEFLLGIAAFKLRARLTTPTQWHANSFEIASILAVAGAVYHLDLIPAFLQRGAIFGPLFAALVLIFSMETGVISQAIRVRWLVYLGDISFAIYMLHQIVIRYVYDTPLSKFLDNHQVVGFVAMLAAIIGVSAVSHRFFEVPMSAWVNRVAARK